MPRSVWKDSVARWGWWYLAPSTLHTHIHTYAASHTYVNCIPCRPLSLQLVCLATLTYAPSPTSVYKPSLKRLPLPGMLLCFLPSLVRKPRSYLHFFQIAWSENSLPPLRSWGMWFSTSVSYPPFFMHMLSRPLEFLVAWDHPQIVFYSINAVHRRRRGSAEPKLIMNV